jgi:hypothetical protein
LHNRLAEIKSNFADLDEFDSPSQRNDSTVTRISSCYARLRLSKALLEFRKALLEELNEMSTIQRQYKSWLKEANIAIKTERANEQHALVHAPGLPEEERSLSPDVPRLPADEPRLPTDEPSSPADVPRLPADEPRLLTDKPSLPAASSNLGEAPEVRMFPELCVTSQTEVDSQMEITNDGNGDGNTSQKRVHKTKRRYKGFDEHVQSLLEYKNKNGHTNVPRGWKENRALGEFLAKARQNRFTKLTDEQRRRLDEIGFDWTIKRATIKRATIIMPQSVSRGGDEKALIEHILAGMIEEVEQRADSNDIRPCCTASDAVVKKVEPQYEGKTEGNDGVVVKGPARTKISIKTKYEDTTALDEKVVAMGSSRTKITTPYTAATIKEEIDTRPAEEKAANLLQLNPWLQYYGERFTLTIAADLLLFYAHTKTFFVMNPYKALTSSSVKVYARELGNAVPRSSKDEESTSYRHAQPVETFDALVNEEKKVEDHGTIGSLACTDTLLDQNEIVDQRFDTPHATESVKNRTAGPELCEPDDIVANVQVSYNGDYVLSQMLQWYNGGIGLKPGLPDLIGCVLLPRMEGCWNSELLAQNKVKSDRTTKYEEKIRPRLIEWLLDPYQRGNPWPEEVSIAFADKDPENLLDPSSRWLPFGSPIVDFLVTGDETSIQEVLAELDANDLVSANNSAGGLLSSVDNGRPAQAVSNWVQCEDCGKWRRIPWHVDIDLLPEKFYCRDNKWEPSKASCDTLEEDWDGADKLVGDDGKVEGSPAKKDRNASLSTDDERHFYIGGKSSHLCSFFI